MTAKQNEPSYETQSDPRADSGDAGILPPRKLYSTGEVIEHTRLSRQTLHNYKRLGLIQPARWTQGGHCYYDESVFERLRKIKLFQRYHSLQEIRVILDEEEQAQQQQQHQQHQSERRTSATQALPQQEAVTETPAETAETPAAAAALELDAPDANLPNATQWSDNEERAPDLAQTLLHARRFPEKLYRIGDLMRLTGYSRQTLHNYTIQGLLQTKDRTASGHRLYGADAFTVLRLIEVYKRHRRFSEVQTLIEQWYKSGRRHA